MALEDQVDLLFTRVVTGNTQGWEKEAETLTQKARELDTSSQKVLAEVRALAPVVNRHLEPLLLRDPWTRQEQVRVMLSAAWVLLVSLVIWIRLRRLRARS